MYFYEIEVYASLLGSEKIIMGHDECFDNHQLNIIVQEAFDECIEKYCNKTILEKGEEACRMEVETIFEKYLCSQLQNHGFKNIKINETCSIMGGTLFCDNGVNNPVLMDRYKDMVLPPCKKCIRKEYVGYEEKCIVPNTRKDNSLPTTRVVKTIHIDLNEQDEDEFNITLLKLYFTNSHKSRVEAIRADEIVDNILENNNFKDYWTEWGATIDSIHEGDIICGFDLYIDQGKGKKLFTEYGFILEDTEDGFWITGVKE